MTCDACDRLATAEEVAYDLFGEMCDLQLELDEALDQIRRQHDAIEALSAQLADQEGR